MPWFFADGAASILEHPSDNFVFLVLMGGIVLFALLAVAGSLWISLRKSEMEACLKQEMIQRGMSADEIERVLAAKSEMKLKRTDSGEQQTLPHPQSERS